MNKIILEAISTLLLGIIAYESLKNMLEKRKERKWKEKRHGKIALF